MEQNRLICDKSGIVWHQIARNKDEAKLKERSVSLPDDAHAAVENFAEFSVEAGGDRYSSVGTAMNEVKAQSKEIIEKIDLAEGEDEVFDYGRLLDASISLLKALESYYVRHFGMRTGTSGD